MKINSITNNSFTGLYNNKTFLKGLENIANHSASFSCGAMLLSSLTLRPLAISMTPKTDKENKKVLSMESIASSLSKFLVSEIIILPIENAISKLDKNPHKFLNKKTIEKLAPSNELITKSKNYNFITQMVKQGTNFLTSIPKSFIGVALVPILLDLFSSKKKKNAVSTLDIAIKQDKNPNFIPFKGKYSDKLTKMVAGIVDNESIQNFAIRHSKKDNNLAKNSAILSDLVLTSSSLLAVNSSKKISKEKKKLLSTNKILSTLISVLLGSEIDKLVQKIGSGSMEKFIQDNLDNKKLAKYIEGINVLRPTIIFAILYYAIIPIITTFVSDKLVDGKDK